MALNSTKILVCVHYDIVYIISRSLLFVCCRLHVVSYTFAQIPLHTDGTKVDEAADDLPPPPPAAAEESEDNLQVTRC